MTWADIVRRDFEPVNDSPPGFESTQVNKRVFCTFEHSKNVENVLNAYGKVFEMKRTKTRVYFILKVSMNERVEICRLLREYKLWMRIRGLDIEILSMR